MDASRSGFVLSAIQGRDYARIYIKDVRNGLSDVELSPRRSACSRKPPPEARRA